MARKKGQEFDWEAIEREYRAGQLSIRQIARQYNISAPAIVKKAEKNNWERNLSEKIRQKVNSKLVNTEVNTVNTQEIIEIAAQRGVEVVRFHRKYLNRLLQVSDKYLEDLEINSEIGYKEKAELLKAVTQAISKAIPF